MDRAAQALDNLHALELRVLDGPQRGASAPLAAGTSWVLAAGPRTHGVDADIVLHEESAAPARVRVTAEMAQALIEVLHGEVRLGDQVLGAGAQAVWPRQTPLQIGSSRVAYGLACVDEWKAAMAASVACGEARDRAAAASAAGPGMQPPARTAPLRRRAEVWLAATGAGVLLACLGTFWMARVVAAPRVPQAAPITLAAALRASEFASLEALPQPDGRVLLQGRLGTFSQRSRLDTWLAARQFTPALDVKVDEALTREVTEVFRVNGVAVQARLTGPGRVDADAAEPDANRLARAEDVVRRDVRGLEQLSVHNSAPPPVPPALPVPDDPGKRIASLVQGDPAYVVTADGARYFVGSMLPSGHRITAVEKQSVTLERDGRRTSLNF
jgi:type III secretion protein D